MAGSLSLFKMILSKPWLSMKLTNMLITHSSCPLFGTNIEFVEPDFLSLHTRTINGSCSAWAGKQ